MVGLANGRQGDNAFNGASGSSSGSSYAWASLLLAVDPQAGTFCWRWL
jgi:hypothetical protein